MFTKRRFDRPPFCHHQFAERPLDFESEAISFPADPGNADSGNEIEFEQELKSLIVPGYGSWFEV